MASKQEITLAAEWFLDNFHVVDEQLREIRDHLPPGYYRRLPKIIEGHLTGHPRVYGIAWAYIAHTDSRVDLDTLWRFVRAYETVDPLTIGELWAIAIHLRLALVENLRRLSGEVVRAREARLEADDLADRLLSPDERSRSEGAAVLSRLDKADLADAFVVQLVQRLRDRDPSTTPAVVWLNGKLGEHETSPADVVAREHQQQASTNATVRNIITSMRWMSSIDWFDFVESVSLVDDVLRDAHAFEAMDFATRDEYRRQVEALARASGRTEIEVAREAANLAGRAQGDDPASDPGYYLLSNGRRELEERLGARLGIGVRTQRWVRRHAIGGYLVGIAAPTVTGLAFLLWLTARSGAGPATMAVMAVFGVVPATEIALALIHRLVAAVRPPRRIAKLELADGVPPHLRTLVAVPTLLTSHAELEQQLERLEVHYLANPDGYLHFALVTDFTDAPHERMPGDEELLSALRERVARLNADHPPPPGGGDRFLALHRRRLWNDAETMWMGWERKRGKLHELNALLRGAADTTFVDVDGRRPEVPDGVRYVITLDADTRLPKAAAYKLVGAMAHPLNTPRFDTTAGRVVQGYAVLQPRITPSLPTGRAATLYQRITSGGSGIDPYAAAISDVYQDLLDEGSYTGKGIYDIDAFERALDGKVGENALLSHDLYEGVFARSGLVTDIELFEDFPTNYEVDARRRHRWARGDWQLLPWILGRAQAADGNRASYRLPALGRWKMIDNLRRTLVAPLSYLVAVTAWGVPTVPSVWWTGLVVAAVAVPALIPVLDGLRPARQGISKRSHARAFVRDAEAALWHVLVELTTVAHRARLLADAVGRTLVRLYVTKRKLLEWVPAAQAGYGIDLHARSFYRHMRWGVVLGVGGAVAGVMANPSSWPVAVPFGVLWAAAPLIACRISTPPRLRPAEEPTAAETQAMRLIARRTWRYFETFVTAEEHALPPDNFQEDPEAVTAHRTSPTNIGLYLLSTTVAHDFGWIGIGDTADRIEDTLNTIDELHRYRGHLFNWYDTRSLHPLEPVYVSTVDSGNLAGHLIAVAEACRAFARRPLPAMQVLDGIRDAVLLVLDSAKRSARPHRTQTVSGSHLREACERMLAHLDDAPTSGDARVVLAELGTQADNLLDIARTLAHDSTEESSVLDWASAVRDCVSSHVRDLEHAGLDEEPGPIGVVHRLSAIALRAEVTVAEMDFLFLFDSSRKIFSIGYRVADAALDPSYYDLLASESRLGSFVAIAKGDVGPQHWFGLGRALTPVGRGAALVSWSGSMFEYLMPLLVMHQPEQSLLDTTCRLVVQRQIAYGDQRRVPWGVSESAHNIRDVELTYQYSDFGVPGLGLRRGLFADVVVAPYATALAAMVTPRSAVENFAALEQAGGLGDYGFYEALDYTPTNLPADADVAVVRAYMAHHQGMTLVSLGNVVHDGATQRRFHDHPMVRATELLLQERTPRSVGVARPRGEEVQGAPLVRDLVSPTLRRFESPHDITPRTHVLSNGRYTVVVTAAGSGFSRFHDLAVTRWRHDSTRDCWGTFVFLRDAASGAVWSAGYQPAGTEVDDYEVVFTEDRARILQTDRSLEITLEVVVSPEDDAELRRVSVTNRETRDREIDFTSYAEVVLATQAADEAHPAFSNLFVQTEFVPELGTILATRRPRSPDEQQLWLAHVVTTEGEPGYPPECETDRARFLGRGRGIRTPLSVIDGGPLSNSVGTVLDPIVSIRQRLSIPQGRTVRIGFTTLVATSREDALDLAEKYRQPTTFERSSSLAWTHAQVQLHHLQITQDEAHLFQRLANRLIYADATSRAAPEVLTSNERGTRDLWPLGISGDLPIALVRIEREEDRDVVRQALRAHGYWRLKGLAADLVIVNETEASYMQDLHDTLEGMVRASRSGGTQTPGDVYLLRGDLLASDDQLLLRAVARIEVAASAGSISEHMVRSLSRRPGPVPASQRPTAPPAETVPPPVLDLELYNGLGGFADAGREYVIVLGHGQWTPAPWINVIANADFGFQVAATGSGYTWSVNSRENKLTPWSNDPVSDTPGEVFYVRDEESGLVWGPTALPIREDAFPYVIRHGQGYSRFEHTSHGIALDLLQLVAPGDPVKISRLRIENRSARTRRLAVTAYVEWVLGVTRTTTAPFVVTESDPQTHAIFARNPSAGEFAGRVAFADLGGRQSSWTADRLEFLGRNGSPDHPLSQERGSTLSGTIGAGLDPCAALETTVELEPGGHTEVLFLLGEAADAGTARSLIERYRSADPDAVLREVRGLWDDVTGTVQVSTPDRAMDLMLNRWLAYQTLACRVWSRSAFYQSGGAYGFRDQLQDVGSLVLTRPDLAREHLLRAAARQFREGDVQHWWHPPTGRGVRTRISDDRLWLPYTLTHYLRTTADDDVLDEQVPWLDGPELGTDEQETYFEPTVSAETSSLYEHCARALDRSLDVGSHGLPLIGAGDWNDGMNRVGVAGAGESAWLGWFLIMNLRTFAPLAIARGEPDRAERWRKIADDVRAALENEAWDGGWYRRAFFDDGTPLGSAANDECQIDSIPQSWAVISGAGDEHRARLAMTSALRRLVRGDDHLMMLFSPPFDRTALDPGYIKGYPPGVRENGGQYTHAATWCVVASAMLGDGDAAVELFNMLSPIQHASGRANLHRYKGEPYVVAADVYSQPPHAGRGGWTWYTGAAGWMYRAGLEWILGFRKHGDSLELDPCIPRQWPGFVITYRYHDTVYRIVVSNPDGVSRGVKGVSLDGTTLEPGAPVPLSADGHEHEVEVVLG